MADLSTSIGSLKLKNPVLTASGTFGYGEEFADFIDLNRLGGFIVKGTTLEPRQGNPYPRMAETPSGMLNAVGLQNKGVDYFIEHIYPRLEGFDTQVMVNVSGSSPEDYAEVCRRLAVRCPAIRGVEVNISCPNVKQGGDGLRHYMRGGCAGCARRAPRMARNADYEAFAQRDVDCRHRKGCGG